MKRVSLYLLLCVFIVLISSCDVSVSSNQQIESHTKTIIMHPGNGTPDIVFTGRQGNLVTLPIPYKNNQQFAYWYDQYNNIYYGGNEFAFSSQDTLELYARWNVKISMPTGYADILALSGLPVDLPIIGDKYMFPFWFDENEKTYQGTIICPSENVSLRLVSYAVGEKGLSGGYIFYDCDADNENGNEDGLNSIECGWRFLECAPSDLYVKSGSYSLDSYSGTPEMAYGYNGNRSNFTNGTTTYDESNCTITGIGTGKENTFKLVSKMKSIAYVNYECTDISDEYAAKGCYDLIYLTPEGIKLDDWFLPSKDELNLMYLSLGKLGLGSFSSTDSYWSSSEDDSNSSYSWYQNLVNGDSDLAWKHNTWRIRSIREF